MAEEIKLVGVFQDNITPQLKKLNTQIISLTKSFEKFGKKLRPIAKEMGNLAAATERVADGLKKQKQSIDAASRSWSNYKREVGKAGSATKKAFPGASRGAPGAPRGQGGRSGGKGVGIGGVALGSALGGLLTTAIIRGFDTGVRLMMKPFEAFASAFAERMGDEMADIQSAGGMMALDQKDGGSLFGGDFEKARSMQERLNASLAKSAAALPGATNDYVRAARGITDTVMMAFGKNEKAFKDLAIELGASANASAEEAITKVLSRFTEQTVLLGMGGSKGGMPLTMLMEQLVTMEQVNVQGMKRRYAQLRQNPLLATMLEGAQEEINAAGAGTAERIKAVMKALDDALPQQVVNAMRRSMEGLVEAARSAFFDPDTGLLGLSRKIKFMVDGVEVESSLFEEIRSIAANLFVPVMELLTFLSDIFDPFASMMPILHKFRKRSKIFFDQFEGMSKWFEKEAKGLFDQANLLSDPAAQKLMRGQAEELKRQAGPRGALAAINSMLADFGVITEGDFQTNLAKLKDFSEEGLKFDFSDMAVSMLKGLMASPIVQELVETIGEALGSFTATIFKAIEGILDSVDGKDGTGNKLIDGFVDSFQKGLGEVNVKEILSRLIDKIIGAIVKAFVDYGLPAIFNGLESTISTLWDSGWAGKLAVIVGGILTLGKVIAIAAGVVDALLKVKAAFAFISSLKIGATIAGWLGAVGPAMASLKVAVMGVAAPFAILAAKIALIVGLALGVVALIRHADYIISSVVESLKIFWNVMQWLGKGMQEFFYTLMSKLPGWLGGGKQWAEKAEKVRLEREKLSADVYASVDKINKNTADSLNRTAKDFERLGNALKGRGLNTNEEVKTDPQVKTPGSNAPSSVPVTVAPVPTGVPPAANPVPLLNTANMHLSEQKAKLEALVTQTTAQKAVIDKLKADLEKSKVELAQIKTEIKGTKVEVSSTKTGVMGALNNLSSKFTGVIKTEVVKMPPMTFPMGGGDPRGGGGGPIGMKASAMGLTMTSHMRPGDPGYHGIGRAWDYSNSTGPTPEMHRFATWLATNYGGNLKELIYTPLGYSIKDGQRVPAFAKDTHYNHVHVAYGMGANSPAFFSSQQDAVKWEKKVAPGNSAIASVTSNSSEFGSANINVQAINISGVNDPKAIANTVATEILFAMKRAENTELDIS